MATELGLSTFNERRLGRASDALSEGRAGTLSRAAKWSVLAGLALEAMRDRIAGAEHLASACYLAGGLAFRFAWIEGGKAAAADHEAVAQAARRPRRRTASAAREPLGGVAATLARGWTESVRRVSLLVDGALRRG
jgi:hypothetical protein